jgi:hypothetical protein
MASSPEAGLIILLLAILLIALQCFKVAKANTVVAFKAE